MSRETESHRCSPSLFPDAVIKTLPLALKWKNSTVEIEVE
jgi:hypothetical protein